MTTFSTRSVIGVAVLVAVWAGDLALATNVHAGTDRAHGGQQQQALVAGLSATDVTAVMQATSYLELSTDAQLEANAQRKLDEQHAACLLYTSPSPRDRG